MGDMNMMHMTFFWGKDLVMLFDNWPNGNLGMYILALFFVCVMAVLIELLSDFPAIKTGTRPIVGVLAQASVYGLRMVIAYFVILFVMSYNVVFLSLWSWDMLSGFF
ncbi:Ctr copper transporter [Artemisia annua]|uniref:Ctr copper transporter n=1 Tax=Artemisia annua TaxID=35608 RepID=A0A2U1L9D8_ARTAN|nr:Ctr copper transporter [Artemisia annua]